MFFVLEGQTVFVNLRLDHADHIAVGAGQDLYGIGILPEKQTAASALTDAHDLRVAQNLQVRADVPLDFHEIAHSVSGRVAAAVICQFGGDETAFLDFLAPLVLNGASSGNRKKIVICQMVGCAVFSEDIRKPPAAILFLNISFPADKRLTNPDLWEHIPWLCLSAFCHRLAIYCFIIQNYR